MADYLAEMKKARQDGVVRAFLRSKRPPVNCRYLIAFL
jgi:hypothetical protein